MPTMSEAAEAAGICQFCNQRSTLLCDGKVKVGDVGHSRTCNKRMCRACAGVPLALAHGRNAGGTRDLCPECRKAGRSIR